MKGLGEEGVNNFGSTMIITRYKNNKDIDVYFPQYDWVFKGTTYKEFNNGKIKCPYERRVCNIGFLGEGEYKSKINKKNTDEYTDWYSMLRRCHNVNLHHREPTYIECEVYEEWYNFQNFAEWYEGNFYQIPNEKMQLDKDILDKGNKIYCPNKCVYVPQRINNLFTKCNTSRGDLPIGVSTYGNKYRAYCQNANGKRVHLGYFYDINSAFLSYKVFKENTIKQVADEYKNFIPVKLYNAMYSYEVEKTD